MNKITLPDTPWHIGYTKKAAEDPRRHKARCVHIKNHKCNCDQSTAYLLKCMGSAHCDCYAETWDEWANYLKSMTTTEQKARRKAQEYRRMKCRIAERAMKEGRIPNDKDVFLGMPFCPICGQRIKRGCTFCGFSVQKFLSKHQPNLG